MSEVTREVQLVRTALAHLPAGAAWTADRSPSVDEVFTPASHRNVLDLNRSLVVGNRGVGKTFWSHALVSEPARQLAANVYNLPALLAVEAVFGFKGTYSDNVAPSEGLLGRAMASVSDPISVWQAVLIRALGQETLAGLPSNFVELARWYEHNVEEADKRIRSADNKLVAERRSLVILFDSLDTIASDWTEIRKRTEGLLRLAVQARGLRGISLKIFMRTDQFADFSMFRFPDASKLRAERAEIKWSFLDLYALMFFLFEKNRIAAHALSSMLSGNPQNTFDNALLGRNRNNSGDFQQFAFEVIAGRWMGRDKKRGRPYSWLVQHLADANGEATPRGFLTALRTAALNEPSASDTVIDYRGIQHGVTEASENRVSDLLQDYWWIDYIRSSLAGLETPLERAILLSVWEIAGVADDIIKASKEGSGVVPVYLSVLETKTILPKELAQKLESREAALLETLRLIGVVEIRPNGKVNFPDIFRVAFKMKRRGGVPPRRSLA